MVFCFIQNFFFRTTRELEYLIFLLRKVQIFFPEFNIRLYDKNSESDYLFSSTKIRIFFSATLGIRIFFQKKTITPPFKLNGRSLRYHMHSFFQFILNYVAILLMLLQPTWIYRKTLKVLKYLIIKRKRNLFSMFNLSHSSKATMYQIFLA